jgi:hypothetical protein
MSLVPLSDVTTINPSSFGSSLAATLAAGAAVDGSVVTTPIASPQTQDIIGDNNPYLLSERDKWIRFPSDQNPIKNWPIESGTFVNGGLLTELTAYNPGNFITTEGLGTAQYDGGGPFSFSTRDDKKYFVLRRVEPDGVAEEDGEDGEAAAPTTSQEDQQSAPQPISPEAEDVQEKLEENVGGNTRGTEPPLGEKVEVDSSSPPSVNQTTVPDAPTTYYIAYRILEGEDLEKAEKFFIENRELYPDPSIVTVERLTDEKQPVYTRVYSDSEFLQGATRLPNGELVAFLPVSSDPYLQYAVIDEPGKGEVNYDSIDVWRDIPLRPQEVTNTTPVPPPLWDNVSPVEPLWDDGPTGAEVGKQLRDGGPPVQPTQGSYARVESERSGQTPEGTIPPIEGQTTSETIELAERVAEGSSPDTKISVADDGSIKIEVPPPNEETTSTNVSSEDPSTQRDDIPKEWIFTVTPGSISWSRTGNFTRDNAYGTNRQSIFFGNTTMRTLSLGECALEGFAIGKSVETKIRLLEKCMEMFIQPKGFVAPHVWELVGVGKSYGYYFIVGVNVAEILRDDRGNATRAIISLDLAEVPKYQIYNVRDLARPGDLRRPNACLFEVDNGGGVGVPQAPGNTATNPTNAPAGSTEAFVGVPGDGSFQPKIVRSPVASTNYGNRCDNVPAGTKLPDPIMVAHETVSSLDSTLNSVAKAGSEISYNAVIAEDGTIHLLTDPTKRAFANGQSVYNGQSFKNSRGEPSVNQFALSFSFVSPPDGRGNGSTHSGYTDAQYRSAAWYMRQSGIPLSRLTTHKEISGRLQGKQDPRSFDLNKFTQIYNSLPAPKETINLGNFNCSARI